MDIIRIAALGAIKQSLETLTLDVLADAYDVSLASAYPDRENPFQCQISELKILPFADWLPELKNLRDFNTRDEWAGEVLRRK